MLIVQWLKKKKKKSTELNIDFRPAASLLITSLYAHHHSSERFSGSPFHDRQKTATQTAPTVREGDTETEMGKGI